MNKPNDLLEEIEGIIKENFGALACRIPTQFSAQAIFKLIERERIKVRLDELRNLDIGMASSAKNDRVKELKRQLEEGGYGNE